MNTPKASAAYWKRVSNTLNYDGVSEWYRAQGCWRKLFWSVIMLGTVVPIVYYTYTLTMQYFTYPSATQMIERQVERMQFPTITVCHSARFNRTYIEEKIDVNMARMAIPGFQATGSNDAMLNDFIYWMEFLAALPYDMGTDRSTASEMIYQFNFNKTASPMAKYEEIPFVSQAALQCPQILKRCVFGIHVFDCCANAKTIFNEYGTCYQVKLVGADGKDAQQIPGVIGGLKVWVEVDRSIVPVGGYDDDVGLRVHVTDGIISPCDNPVYIPPNKHALVRIDATQLSFDPSIDECTQTPPPLIQVTTYTQGSCSSECLQNISVARCGCRPIGFGVEMEAEKTCTPLKMATCVMPLTLGASGDDEDMEAVTDQNNCVFSNCPKQCQQMIYDTYVSYQDIVPATRFPHRYVVEDPVPNGTDTFVFTAFYGEIKYTQIASTPLWDLNTFICNLGGLLGLWTGLSIITLIQAAIYCWYIPCCYEGGKTPTFLVPELYEKSRRAKK